jgi:hypothetical protein
MPLTSGEPWYSQPIRPTYGDSSLSIPGSLSKSPEREPPISRGAPPYVAGNQPVTLPPTAGTVASISGRATSTKVRLGIAVR